MSDDIKYIGITDTVEPNTKTNAKPETIKKFKTNKSSSKVNKFISSTKKSIFNKKFLMFAAIVALLYFFNPITYLKTALDNKREYYAQVREENALKDIENGNKSNGFLQGLFDVGKMYATTSYERMSAFDYTFGRDYYKNCRNTMVWPVDGLVTYHYDLSHLGIDIVGNDYPANVYAAANGTVTYIGYSEKYGNELMIEHHINGMTLYTFYGNLSVITVSQGQYLAQGQVIGKEAGQLINSDAGQFAPGQHHIHFEVRKEDQSYRLNPYVFLGYQKV